VLGVRMVSFKMVGMKAEFKTFITEKLKFNVATACTDEDYGEACTDYLAIVQWHKSHDSSSLC
jgi:hypothetical protein